MEFETKGGRLQRWWFLVDVPIHEHPQQSSELRWAYTFRKEISLPGIAVNLSMLTLIPS